MGTASSSVPQLCPRPRAWLVLCQEATRGFLSTRRNWVHWECRAGSPRSPLVRLRDLAAGLSWGFVHIGVERGVNEMGLDQTGAEHTIPGEPKAFSMLRHLHHPNPTGNGFPHRIRSHNHPKQPSHIRACPVLPSMCVQARVCAHTSTRIQVHLHHVWTHTHACAPFSPCPAAHTCTRFYTHPCHHLHTLVRVCVHRRPRLSAGIPGGMHGGGYLWS